MREPSELAGRPAGCLQHWTALAGATDALTWSIYSDGHLLVAALDGELDLGSGPALAQQLDPLAQAGRHLILDLGALDFCDCTGLTFIVCWQRQAVAAGGVLQLVGAGPRFHRLTALTRSSGLDQAGVVPCRRNCCVRSHLEQRPPAAEPH
jgi:anti-sigma B factor antagonist